MPTPLDYAKLLIESRQPSVWTRGGGLTVYMRRGGHAIDGKFCTCLDIANITVDEPGNGVFTEFLTKIEQEIKMKIDRQNSCKYIFVESIMNPRLADYLKRRGYKTTQDSIELSPNMYKEFNKASCA